MHRFFTLLLATTLVSPALSADMREISGAAAYRERIALPPEAELMVEVTGFQKTELATLQQSTDGKQVPLPFKVSIPSDLKAELHAAILVDGSIRWVSEPVAIDAGTEAVNLGPVQLSGYVPSGFQTTYICGDQRFSVGFDEEGAVVEGADWIFNLPQAISADGAKFASADGKNVFWSKGSQAMLTIDGRTLPECEALPHEARKSWQAQGNEPGWQARISEDRLMLNLNYGSDRLDLTSPEVRVANGSYHYDIPDLGLSLSVQDKLCEDDMTGRPFPQTVSLKLADGSAYRGCGGETMSLLTGNAWMVETISGDTVGSDDVPTLEISSEGRISGFAGCNRYMGAFAIDGEGNLEVGPLAATNMACMGDMMQLEDKFLPVLDSVDSLRFSEDGALILLSGGEPVIKATR
ncbi:META domain-containing protein [Martelella mediterranea]|uniref:Heat shock protein HslJ n=1 Tax=Martelella mediterranea TaxID=293089 RepID=A0A4R3NH22_9HYPH|nr:META domain-containing protein [Martelella mediterranea]TCT33022.1 heat shock protein HslJ [Martelella mediterranea]